MGIVFQRINFSFWPKHSYLLH